MNYSKFNNYRFNDPYAHMQAHVDIKKKNTLIDSVET